MLEPAFVIHVRGRSPSHDHIAQQRREQLRAIRLFHDALKQPGRPSSDPRADFSEARGLPRSGESHPRLPPK